MKLKSILWILCAILMVGILIGERVTRADRAAAAEKSQAWVESRRQLRADRAAEAIEKVIERHGWQVGMSSQQLQRSLGPSLRRIHVSDGVGGRSEIWSYGDVMLFYLADDRVVRWSGNLP